MELFQDLVYSEDSDIIFVNETWLKKDICDLEILHSGYSIFRNDRKTRGGGVLLGVKTSSFKSVHEIKRNYDLEIILAEITTATNMKIILGSCYRPPNEDQTWIERFTNFLGNICSSHQHIVLAGDFNLPQISWNSPEQTTGFSENAIIELLNAILYTAEVKEISFIY
jgi:exonuclease III